MKNLIFLLTLCLVSIIARANPTDTLHFTVQKSMAAYVVANVNDFGIKSAISAACKGMSSMDGNVEIVVTEQQVLTIYVNLTHLSEGIANVPNTTLNSILAAKLGSRVWLANEIGKVATDNDNSLTDIQNRGALIMDDFNNATRYND